MHARHALGGANRITFKERSDYGDFLFSSESVHFVLAFQVKASQNGFEESAFWLAGLSVLRPVRS